MRYSFIPLALVFLLAGCGKDPTGPVLTPVGDAGRVDPNPHRDVPDVCLREFAQAGLCEGI
jgi:hypothetical protein